LDELHLLSRFSTSDFFCAKWLFSPMRMRI
jgi:hypothetical protein